MLLYPDSPIRTDVPSHTPMDVMRQCWMMSIISLVWPTPSVLFNASSSIFHNPESIERHSDVPVA